MVARSPGSLALLGALVALLCGPLEAGTPEPGSWQRLADMPTARLAAAAVCANGRIYVVGGCIVQGQKVVPVAAVEEFCPATNTWRTRSPLPTPRSSLGLALVGGRIFAIGGTTGDTTSATAVVEVYDPASDTWSAASSMPTPRCQVAVAALGDRIYAIGGNQGHDRAFEAYEPITDRWSVLPTLRTPRRDARSAVLGNLIYVSGGLQDDGQRPVDTLQAYDAIAARWTDCAPARLARCDAALVADRGNLVAVGGYHHGPTTSVEAYDSRYDRWAPWPDLPRATQFHCAVALEGKVFVFGGSHRLPAATNEVYVWHPAHPSPPEHPEMRDD